MVLTKPIRFRLTHMPVHVEIADCPGAKGRIDVRFTYDRDRVAAMRTVAGRSYVKTPDKHWHVPLDMETCRQLREAFGNDLKIGPELKAWALAQVRMENQMQSISLSESATLTRLPAILPQLAEAIHLGPLGKNMTLEERIAGLKQPGSYQAADTLFMSEAIASLNGNQPGLGKTLEYYASIFEAGLELGCHLVVAPVAAVSGTWGKEGRIWLSDAIGVKVEVFPCTDSKADRMDMLQAFINSTADVKIVIVNPAMLTLRKDKPPKPVVGKFGRIQHSDFTPGPITMPVTSEREKMTACKCNKGKGKPHFHYTEPWPELFRTKWRTVCVDESHKNSIRNHKSITSKSLGRLSKDAKRTALTGTPMRKAGGADIWGILNWLRPDVFTSYWRFAEQYFEIEDNGFGKKVGKLRPEREDAFWRMLAPYVVRRLKKEVAPWLPDKMYKVVDCFMSGKQLTQYIKMEKEGAAELDGLSVYAEGVLDRFTRLKQFANAEHVFGSNGQLVPVASCKVDALVEKLEELGANEDPKQKHLVFSQFKQMVEFAARTLEAKGYKVAVLSGDTKGRGVRDRMMEDFQEGDIQILCIVTTAGGVSLTLDAADDVHQLDEMWDPGDDEQAEDRAHRVSRIHQVTVWTYQTVDSIDQYIASAKIEKKEGHELILDVRREILRRRVAGKKDSS